MSDPGLRRQPVLAIIAGAVLALSLFAPLFLIAFPIMITVALCIASIFRKELPRWLPYVIGSIAIVVLLVSNYHRFNGLAEQPVIKASDIYREARWEYGSTMDEMRHATEPNATLYSATDLDLPTPYDGTNAASIFVSRSEGLMLTVSKGRFDC